MPGFQTKPLTITIISGNDSIIVPRNVMACCTHVLSQSWFWAIRIRNSLWCFFRRVQSWRFVWPKYTFSQSPHGIEYTACVFRSIGQRSLGSAKICSNVWNGFRAKLLRTLLIVSAIPWMYGTIAKPFTAESPSEDLQSVKVGCLKQS